MHGTLFTLITTDILIAALIVIKMDTSTVLITFALALNGTNYYGITLLLHTQTLIVPYMVWTMVFLKATNINFCLSPKSKS